LKGSPLTFFGYESWAGVVDDVQHNGHLCYQVRRGNGPARTNPNQQYFETGPGQHVDGLQLYGQSVSVEVLVHKDILAVREKHENAFFGSQKELEAQALALWNTDDQKAASALLTQHADAQATGVLKDWWALSEQLYIRYNDGNFNTPDSIAQPVFLTGMVA
jgi:hypothetical protein